MKTKIYHAPTFAPECYFKNPRTGEGGYTIRFPEIVATSKAVAAAKIKSLPNFDCFIDPEWDAYND